MDSGMISKIQKAKRYAEEPERVVFQTFSVIFHGEHSNYTVTYDQGEWSCECPFFGLRGVCSHTMAMERLLAPMIHLVPTESEGN